MSVIGLASAKASPGVTTSVLALAATWPTHRPLLIVEADADGGDLAARAGLVTDPGLSSLATAGRRALTDGELERHTQAFPGGIPVVLGPADSDLASRALTIVAERLALDLAEQPDRDVLIDCGRLRPGSPTAPLATGCDRLVLVARPRLDELQHLQPILGGLTAGPAGPPALLLVGERPYAAAEVAHVLGVPVLATLPEDPTTADRLNGYGGGRRDRLARSGLLRSARDAAETLVATPTPPEEAGGEPVVSDVPASSALTAAPGEPLVSENGDGERPGWAAALTPGSPTTRGTGR
jgi:hypothetical protein